VSGKKEQRTLDASTCPIAIIITYTTNNQTLIMNKFIAAVLVVAAIMESATAFSTGTSSLASRRASSAPLGPSLEFKPTSSTALNLKVKVDPNAKGNKNVAGNAKMAA
jgi:hypothetical protein